MHPEVTLSICSTHCKEMTTATIPANSHHNWTSLQDLLQGSLRWSVPLVDIVLASHKFQQSSHRCQALGLVAAMTPTQCTSLTPMTDTTIVARDCAGYLTRYPHAAVWTIGPVV